MVAALAYFLVYAMCPGKAQDVLKMVLPCCAQWPMLCMAIVQAMQRCHS